jgi:uroporphyrin-III C-methyltransferase
MRPLATSRTAWPTEDFMSLLPIFLKLDGRRCLLVGAGNVALDKIVSLLKVGPLLRVVAPRARPEIRQLAAEGKLEWVQRSFEMTDLDGNFLVIAATDSPEVNALVYQGSVERGILCNSVDDIPHCDFYFGSVVSRGDLQIAISTAGQSPAVAQRLRREIDEQLPEDLGPWLENLGQLRREVLEAHPGSEARKSLLHLLAQRQVCESEFCPSRQVALAPLEDEQTAEDETADGDAAIFPEDECLDLPEPFLFETDLLDADLLESKAEPYLSPETVYLVGAGPGDPELLTLKALRLIQTADVLLHDDLVPQAILDLASPSAEILNVGKRCGSKAITQDAINSLMIERARENRSVIRLKGGDPLLFGRAAEEMTALTEAGVPFEVVPGISAAFAAAAAIGCSLTSRNGASSVIFSSGHHAQSGNLSGNLNRPSPLPKRKEAMQDLTRVVYMPGRDLHRLAQEWLQQGLTPDLPCAVVSRATQPGQQIRCTTLAALGDAEPVLAPSLLIAGWAVGEIAAANLIAAGGVPVTA